MNWFANLFKATSQNTSDSNTKWLEGYHSFERGKSCFIDRDNNDALNHFDKAIENGFESEVFGLRAMCLQGLDYHYDAIDDFNKAISLSPEDCNLYYSRSVSKGAIRDFEGEVADLEKAIKLSKEDNELNRVYNDEAQKQGHTNGVAGMFEMSLMMAKVNLDFEINERNRELNATPELKTILQEMKSKRVKLIKRRGE